MSEQKEKVVYSKWIKKGANTFLPTDNNSEFKEEIDAGTYEICLSDGIGFYMFKKQMYLDELIEFPTAVHKEVLNSIKEFWKRKAKFKEYGFAFKRGILLHGKPGSGKTGIINLSVKYVINELNGVVLTLSNPSDLARYSQFIPEIFRIIEPNRPIIVIFEDIENLQHSSMESELLNVLDGLDQLENVVYIATTNYIEHLKERITNRPSRFDRRIYVPFLDEESRRYFFEKKLKPGDLEELGKDLDKWVKDTERMSIAHLAELIKSVIIFGNPYEEAIDILRKLNEFDKENSKNYERDSKSTIGFNKFNGEVQEKILLDHRQEKSWDAGLAAGG